MHSRFRNDPSWQQASVAHTAIAPATAAADRNCGRGLFRYWGRLWVLSVLLMATACAAPSPGRRAPVPPEPPPLPRAEPARALQSIRYTIQAGAFSALERAAAYADALDAAGIDAYHFIDADGLSKVRFGRFDSKAAAREYAAGLVSRGIIDDYYIVRPRPSGAAEPSNAALRETIVGTARRYLGVPYRWGGTSAREGFDCSGLTMTVYRLNGLALPRTAEAQYRAGAAISKSALKAGDLVFFRTASRGGISHVGIYSGDGKFIHAPGRGKRIRTASLANRYFRNRFAGACRYF
jgi:cell wall-associated NlpC family hydrolase